MDDRTIFQTRQVARRPYLLSCVRISLLKRWAWIAAAGLIAGAFAFVLNLNTLDILALGILTALAVAGGIAVNSWARHSSDL